MVYEKNKYMDKEIDYKIDYNNDVTKKLDKKHTLNILPKAQTWFGLCFL